MSEKAQDLSELVEHSKGDCNKVDRKIPEVLYPYAKLKRRPSFVTPEYIAAQRARKEAERKAKPPVHKEPSLPGFDTSFIKRELIYLTRRCIQDSVSIMSYNVLAQSLIRRTLFPTNGDALKWKYRSKMLSAELEYYKPDILCLQEVDTAQLDSFYVPQAQMLNYDYIFDSGQRKTHGLLVMWSKQKFALISRKTINLDEPLHGDITLRVQTRNIGLAAILNTTKSGLKKYIAIATAHLFWHPLATYERMVQTAKFIDEVFRFTNDSQYIVEETIFAADFNTEPFDPTYQAMTVRPIEFDPKGTQILDESMNYRYKKKLYEEVSEEEDGDAVELDYDSLCLHDNLKRVLQIYNNLPCLQSVYGLGYKQIHPANATAPWGEPHFTNWAKVYRGTLDYIFMIKQINGQAIKLNGLLLLPEEKEMKDEGEPSEGRYPSDHLAIMANVDFR